MAPNSPELDGLPGLEWGLAQKRSRAVCSLLGVGDGIPFGRRSKRASFCPDCLVPAPSARIHTS